MCYLKQKLIRSEKSTSLSKSDWCQLSVSSYRSYKRHSSRLPIEDVVVAHKGDYWCLSG